MTTLPGPSWVAPITIDMLTKVAKVSVLHPFVAWMVPLGFRAQAMSWTNPLMLYATVYAAVRSFVFALEAMNRRLAHGPPRPMDFGAEVVVITGGASGLGLLLAEVYGMRGAAVAVLDVEPVEASETKGITSYICDVGDAAEVQTVAARIEIELGTPTIIVNNAGIVNGRPLLSLSIEEIERNFKVNLLSHFYTLKAFLPGVCKLGRGTIVTVSSVLGTLGAASLSDYSAAKAGLTAMHKSLTAELRTYPNIKTILVQPGQLSTALFDGVVTPSDFFAPVLEPVEVAKEIIRAIDSGNSAHIAAPVYARWSEFFNVLPGSLQRLVRWISGIDVAMENFRGRAVKKAM